MTAAIRALIVDDEAIARRGIRSQLRDYPNIAIVGECRNGADAVQAIREMSPDVVFLDVQMPGLGGFDVIAQIGAENMPLTIFVTAFDQYALQAFACHALDYVLKPIDGERLHHAVDWAARQLHHQESAAFHRRLEGVLAFVEQHQQSTGSRFLERMVIKEAGRMFFLDTREIDWAESAGNYVKLHVGAGNHLLRDTLTALEHKLDPRRFVRVRHAAIVNLDAVREFHPLFKGSYALTLRNGRRLISSRHYRSNLEKILRPQV